MARVVEVRNTLSPVRHHRVINAPDGAQLKSLCPVDESLPVIMVLNGQPVLRADWQYALQKEDFLVVVILPQGGGGGSNPMRLVLMLAVMVAAAYLGPAVGIGAADALGLDIAIDSAYALGSSAILMAGSALVNVMLPPPRPTSGQAAQQLASPSPTYNIQAQGNLARLGSAIPVQYGRMQCFPDFASLPYTEYAGNEQYLYQLLCLGQGYFDIEGIYFADTSVDSFSEITTEIIEPGGTVSLFPVNVETNEEVSGQELLTDVIVGPFIANAASSVINYIGFDFVFPRGLYHVLGDGTLEELSVTMDIDVRLVDDYGSPAGDWYLLSTKTYTARTTTPQRVSYKFGVSSGRYEARVTRTDTKETDTDYGHEALWGSLRGYLPQTQEFGNVTLIAMQAKASNNLSNALSRKVNVICTRKLPIWDGEDWSEPTATRSIAWAFADAAMNTEYGGKQGGAAIDLDTLLYLDSVWSERGDEFNGRFDSALSLWESLVKILSVGRAKPYQQGGMLRLFRDEQQEGPVQLFNMRNIIKGSFSVEYLMPDEDRADHVVVSYYDDIPWHVRTVSCALPGSQSEVPAKLDMTLGCTSRNQAFREGMFYIACNRYRPKVVKFQTDMEGYIPSPGDEIAFAHDMIQWGQTAELVANSGSVYVVTEDLVWGVGNHYVGFRKPDGSLSGPWLALPPYSDLALLELNGEVLLDSNGTILHCEGVEIAGEVYQPQRTFQLQQELDFTPWLGDDAERTTIAFGSGETWRQPLKVVSVRPRSLNAVEIEAINDEPAVHVAEDGLFPQPVIYSQLPTQRTAPVIRGLFLRSSALDITKALLTWSPAPGADIYQIEMAEGSDPDDPSLSWTRVGETTASNYAVTVIYGANTVIRVRGVGFAVGPWTSKYFGGSSDFMWTVDSALMWDADDETLMWG